MLKDVKQLMKKSDIIEFDSESLAHVLYIEGEYFLVQYKYNKYLLLSQELEKYMYKDLYVKLEDDGNIGLYVIQVDGSSQCIYYFK